MSCSFLIFANMNMLCCACHDCHKIFTHTNKKTLCFTPLVKYSGSIWLSGHQSLGFPGAAGCASLRILNQDLLVDLALADYEVGNWDDDTNGDDEDGQKDKLRDLKYILPK